MFVVGRHINVERKGKLVQLNPGEPVPEAATFPHDVLMRCMKVGQIVSVEQKTKASLEPKALPKVATQPAAAKPLSTSIVNHGQRKKGLSSSDAAKRNAKKKAS